MKTRVASAAKEVLIGDGRPTVLIGERLNPTGKSKLCDALRSGNLEFLREIALEQVQFGADILDINVGIPGLDEVSFLPEVVQMLMATVEVPLCIDSGNPEAIEAALNVYSGKPIINSVNGEDRSMREVLPLVKEYGAVVIGLTMDEQGIPNDSNGRLRIAHKIVEKAEIMGIPREDIMIDPLAMSVGADNQAGLVTIETIRNIRVELGINMTMGASNISFGLPDRDLINRSFLAIAIAGGVTCPIVDVVKAGPTVLAADLALGRDNYAKRYITGYRQRRIT